MKNICLFGGSFDPFHRGHGKIVDYALSLSFLDEVWILPTVQNPDKAASFFSFAERVAIIEQILLNQENWTRCRLLTIPDEISLYTKDTIFYLSAQYPDYQFCLVMGTDTFRQIPSWKEYSSWIEKVSFLLFYRDLSSQEQEGKREKSPLLEKRNPRGEESLFASFPEEYASRVDYTLLPELIGWYNSTQIREQIKQYQDVRSSQITKQETSQEDEEQETLLAKFPLLMQGLYPSTWRFFLQETKKVSTTRKNKIDLNHPDREGGSK